MVFHCNGYFSEIRCLFTLQVTSLTGYKLLLVVCRWEDVDRGGGECTPVISVCVDTPQDAAPSRARRGRWGGVWLRARTPRVAPPPTLREISLRAQRVRVPVFLLGVEGGGTPGLYPLTWPLGLCFALQLFYFLLHWLCS